MNARWTAVVVIATLSPIGVACGEGGDDSVNGEGGTAGAGAGGTGGGAGGGNGGSGGSAGASGGAGGQAGTGTGGTGGTGGGGSGVDPAANLRDLTPEQKGELCDWAMMLVGGYGARNTCSDGSTIQNYADRAQCVAVGFMFACAAVTVGDLERCQTARIPSKGCTSPEEECAALYCVQ